MSPASYLTAPPRGVGQGYQTPAATIDGVPWWTWVAVGVFAASAVVGTAAAVVLVVRTVRSLRAFGKTVGATLERLTAATDELEQRSEALSGRSAELDESMARLRASLARLSVLVWALRDALAFAGRLRAAVPSK